MIVLTHSFIILICRNIFLREGKIKLGDFGISRILVGTSDYATTFTGTPYYMSPEVLKHEGYNSKSDIWYVFVAVYIYVCVCMHSVLLLLHSSVSFTYVVCGLNNLLLT